MTFDDLRLETIRAAQNLEKRGYQSRQMFGFLAGDSAYLASIIMAFICSACPIAPVHPMLTKEELKRILAKIKPIVIFCDAESYGQLDEVLEGLKPNVKVFTFGETILGLESVDNLFIETSDENNFL